MILFDNLTTMASIAKDSVEYITFGKSLLILFYVLFLLFIKVLCSTGFISSHSTVLLSLFLSFMSFVLSMYYFTSVLPKWECCCFLYCGVVYSFCFFDPPCFCFQCLLFKQDETFCSNARFITITMIYKSLTLNIFAIVAY